MSFPEDVINYCHEVQKAFAKALPSVDILMEVDVTERGNAQVMVLQRDGHRMPFFSITAVTRQEDEPVEGMTVLLNPKYWDLSSTGRVRESQGLEGLKQMVEAFLDEPAPRRFIRSWV